MKSYKDVCGVDSCVWFEISPKEGKKFLKWAKELGCVWVNGEIIEPRKGADFFHFSITLLYSIIFMRIITTFSLEDSLSLRGLLK